MKYLILCCFNEDRWEAIPESERDAVMEDYQAWIERVDESGRHVASAKLAPSSGGVTLRAGNDKPVVTDGPFAETKEQLGGYHVVECADFDEAVALASGIPTLRVGGTIEVREVVSTH